MDLFKIERVEKWHFFLSRYKHVHIVRQGESGFFWWGEMVYLRVLWAVGVIIIIVFDFCR